MLNKKNDSFNHFVITCFQLVPTLPLMMVCILLLRHFDVATRFPAHTLVQKVGQFKSDEKLLEMHDFIRQSFFQENRNALPLRVVLDTGETYR